MSDFDRIFDAQYTAVDLFTDRTAEHESFERSVTHHLERVLDGTAALANTARHNVLTFYGVGGIGKTELSRRLERWVLGELPETGEWGPVPGFDRPARTVRVDFHGTVNVNPAEIVLRLRAALADSGRRFPAFDLGVAAWWALAHPGLALPDLRSPAGFDVRAQINDTLNQALTEAGARFGVGPLTVRTGNLLVEAIRSRLIRNRALRDCAPLNAIIEQARFDPSPYVAASLAGLLSWDFERLADGRKPLVVVFVDAAEYVQGGDRGQERLLNRIVHLTPGFLWVVTSRSSLDWDSEAVRALLPATGPAVWPGLGDGRQSLARRGRPGTDPRGSPWAAALSRPLALDRARDGPRPGRARVRRPASPAGGARVRRPAAERMRGRQNSEPGGAVRSRHAGAGDGRPAGRFAAVLRAFPRRP